MFDFNNIVIGFNHKEEVEIMRYFTSRTELSSPEKIKPFGVSKLEDFLKAAKNIDKQVYSDFLQKRRLAKLADIEDRKQWIEKKKEFSEFKREHPFVAFVAELVERGGLTSEFELNQKNFLDLSKPVKSKLALSQITETIILPDGQTFLVGQDVCSGTSLGHEFGALLLNICGVDLSKCVRQTSDMYNNFPIFSSLFEYVEVDPLVRITDEQAQAMYNIYRSTISKHNIPFMETIYTSYHLGLGVKDTNWPYVRKHNGLTLEDQLGKGIFDYNEANKYLVEMYKAQGKI